MSERNRLLIIIVAAVLVVGAIGSAVVFYQGDDTSTTPTDIAAPADTTTDTPTTPDAPVSSTDGEQVTDQPIADNGAASVARLARTFMERYGSYSNRNNFENITALEPFMTNSFQEEQLTFIDSQQGKGIESEFYGIATEVLTQNVAAYEEDKKATVEVQMRRVESKGQEEDVVFIQSADVRFVYVAGSWKINGLKWK